MKQAIQSRINTSGADNVGTGELCCLTDFPRRFVSKVKVNPDSGCWLWIGTSTMASPRWPEHRYGRYAVTVTPFIYTQIAHRFAYEFATKSTIPQGLEIDHLCQNKLCVNPKHLELVTHQENCKRRKRSGPLPKAVRRA